MVSTPPVAAGWWSVDLVVDLAVDALGFQRFVHGLHPGTVLVALAWPRRAQVHTLLVVTTFLLDVTGQPLQLAGAKARHRNHYAIQVGAAAVVGARSRCGFAGLYRNADLCKQGREFFVRPGNRSPWPRALAGGLDE